MKSMASAFTPSISLDFRGPTAVAVWAALASAVIVAASFAIPALVSYAFAPAVGLFALYSYFYFRPAYLTLCLWLFFLTPLIRRIIDLQIGWQTGNIIMLSAYIVMIPMALAWLDMLVRGKGVAAVATWVAGAACLYGFLLAGFKANVAAGALDFARWLFPLLMVAFIVQHANDWSEFRRVISVSFAIAIPILSLYGIWQFLNPPPWDAFWMIQAGMNSIGRPFPFEVRVFATLNSPGSLACVLVIGLLLALAEMRPYHWPGLVLGGTALLLTQARAPWAGCLIGAMLLLATLPPRRLLTMIPFGAFAVVAGTMAFAIPEINDVVTARIESFSELEGDRSAEMRMKQYEDLDRRLDQLIIGNGFGITGKSRGGVEKDTQIVTDSAIVEGILTIGLLGCLPYFGAYLLLGVQAITRSIRHDDFFVKASGAIVLCVLLQLPFGSVLIGEWGVLTCVFLGMALAAPRRAELLIEPARNTDPSYSSVFPAENAVLGPAARPILTPTLGKIRHLRTNDDHE
jgi:hypothetical protein